MKISLALLFSLFAASASFAQANNFYADAAINYLGASFTYDRKLTKHLDIGAGMQVYDYVNLKYGNIVSSIFVDIRPNWKIRNRHLLFLVADFGATLHAGRKMDPAVGKLEPLGAYAALGYGYGYMINKRNMGPYFSFNMRGAGYHERRYDAALPPPARDYSIFTIDLVLSLGFKF
jgi:hypothetical protein